MMVLPVQCRACVHAVRDTPEEGTWVPSRCAAYPEGIPQDIAMYGEDHRQVRGDERRGGLTFKLLETPEGRQAFEDWRQFAGDDDR